MNELFVKSIYASIVEGNVAIYDRLFNEEDSDDTIEYWKNARKLYSGLDVTQREVLLSILRQVIIDTMANVFGVIDGICGFDENDWEFKLEINGQSTEDDLSDDFLRYVEMLEEDAQE